MKVRVYEEPSGHLRILHPNGRLQEEGETDDAFFARVVAKAEAGDTSLRGLPFTDVDESLIPSDRSSRDGWRIKDGIIS